MPLHIRSSAIFHRNSTRFSTRDSIASLLSAPLCRYNHMWQRSDAHFGENRPHNAPLHSQGQDHRMREFAPEAFGPQVTRHRNNMRENVYVPALYSRMEHRDERFHPQSSTRHGIHLPPHQQHCPPQNDMRFHDTVHSHATPHRMSTEFLRSPSVPSTPFDINMLRSFSPDPPIIVKYNDWKPNRVVTTFANQLIFASEVYIGADVLVIPGRESLMSEEHEDVFIRTDDRGMWDAIYKRTQDSERSEQMYGHNAIVTGTPGVGLSQSLLYMLRRLLRNGKVVVFDAVSDGDVHIFVPTSPIVPASGPEKETMVPHYEVWSVSSNRFIAQECVALKNPNTYLLIDDPRGKEIPHVDAHTICVASSNLSYLKSFSEAAHPVKYFSPDWTYDELNVVRQHMQHQQRDSLTQDEFDERFFIHGGLPRTIFHGNANIDSAVRQTIPESVSDVSLDDLMNRLSSAPSTDSKAIDAEPPGLFALTCKPGLQDEEKYLLKNAAPQVGSDFAAYCIFAEHYKELMLRMRTEKNPTLKKRLIETFVRIVAQLQHKHEVKSIGDNQPHVLELPPAAHVIHKPTWSHLVQDARALPRAEDLRKKRVLMSLLHPKGNIADMLDARNRGYIVVTNPKHPIDGKLLGKKIETLLGTGKEPFHLYFLVPGEKGSKDDLHALFEPQQDIVFEYPHGESLADYTSLTEDEIRDRTKQYVVRVPVDSELRGNKLYQRIKARRGIERS